RGGIRTVELLRYLADDDRARGVEKTLELQQVLSEMVAAVGPLEGSADDDCTLDGRGERYQFSRDLPAPDFRERQRNTTSG
ncbi:MAG: hypothetical protein M3Z17_09950, partial [Gemmatimonadota bacterium]|nr:hypothetical protein [Gemmatimonadota bacterium]